MTSVYRYLRLKMVATGLYPDTRLGRAGLYLLVTDMFLVVLRQVLTNFERTNAWGSALGGWIGFLTFVLVPIAFILALRWFRATLLWRLRNRLVVTYVFIGVIPLVLLLAMGVLAGYLFAGQLASYLAASDLDTELKSLEMANSVIASQLVHKIEQGQGINENSLPAINPAADERFTGREITAWYRGRSYSLTRTASPKVISKPEWLKDHYRGLVLEGNQPHLRVATIVTIKNEPLTVISSMPLKGPVLERASKGLGELTLYLTNLRINDEKEAAQPQPAVKPQDRPALAVDTGKPKSEGGMTINLNEGTVKTGPKGRERSVPPNVSAGTIPPPVNRFDKAVIFGHTPDMRNWQTGEDTTPLLRVQTRPSVLYQRLASAVGETSTIVVVGLQITAIFFAFIELMALIVGVSLTRTITRSVAALYQATQYINRGELTHRIRVKSRDQLAALETSFNSMTESLQKLLEEQKEKQRIENELVIAQEVQAQLFPKEIHQLESLEVHGLCRPARTVSGDYYDFLPLGQQRLGLAVGDVSGKGVSAALLMATIHSAVRAYEFGRMPMMRAHVLTAAGGGPTHVVELESQVNGGMSPAEVLGLLNTQLFNSTPMEKYATLFLGIYDGNTRRITYSNAGHLPPLIIGVDGSVQRLDQGGLVVGLFDGVKHDEQTVQLHPGDIFLAYSDGITEPENEFGEFGEQRLLDLVIENRDLPLERISETVTAAVFDWIGGNEQPDDVTLVLARVR